MRPEENRFKKLLIGCGCATLILVLLAFVWFVKENRDNVRNLNQTYVEGESLHKAQDIGDVFDSYCRQAETAALLYSKIEDPSVPDRALLTSLEKTTNFYRVSFVDKRGNYYTGSGLKYDVTGREYYTEGIAGKSGAMAVLSAQSSGESVMAYYSPVIRHNKVVGVIVGFCGSEQMSAMLTSNYRGYPIRTYLCTDKGDILARYDNDLFSKDIKDIYGMLIDEGLYNEDDIVQARKLYESGENISFTIQGIDGDSVGHMRHIDAYGLCLLQIFPAEAEKSMISDTNRLGFILGAMLLSLSAIELVVLLIVGIRVQRKAKRDAKSYGYVTKGMQKIIDSHFLVDLTTGRYEFVLGLPSQMAGLQKTGPYDDLRVSILSEIAFSEERKEVDETLQFDTIRSRIDECNGEIRISYPVNMTRTRWQCLIILSVEKTGDVTDKVLITRLDVTELKLHESENLRQMKIINALARDYDCIFLAEVKTGTLTTYRMNDAVREIYKTLSELATYTNMMLAFVMSNVVAEDREKAKADVEMSRVADIVMSEGSFRYNYRVEKDGGIEWHQMYAVGIDEECRQIVIGFRSIDAEIKHEEEQKETLRALLTHENLFRRAITSDAVCFFEVNVTKDKLETGMTLIIDQEEQDLFSVAGVSSSSSFSEAVEMWGERKLISGREEYERLNSCANMKEMYDAGKYSASACFWTYYSGHQYIYVEEMLSLICDEEGDLHAMVIVKDQTESNRLAEERHRSEEIIKNLSSDYNSIYYVDLEQDVTTAYRLNGEMLGDDDENRTLSLPYSQAIKEYIDRIVYHEDRREMVRATRIDSIKRNLVGKKSFTRTYRSEYDGNLKYYEMKVVKVGDDRDFSEIVIGFVDKDDDVRREKEELQRLEIIQGLSSEYVCIGLIDPEDGTWNLFQLKNLDPSVARILIQPMYKDIVHDYAQLIAGDKGDEEVEERASIETVIDALKKNNRYVLSFHDDKEQYFQLMYYRASNEDGKARIVLAALPYTENINKEMEQQRILKEALAAAEQASNAKSSFLSSMSHDIRTPMNAIIGFTDSARKHIEDTEKVSDCLDKISSSSTHLLSLINEVLDMSRIESGKMVVNEGNANIFRMVEDIQSVVLPEAEKKKQKVITDLEGVTDANVICDETWFKRIIINLLSNAVKFTQERGRITFSIKEGTDLKDDFRVFEIDVADNGIGMSEEFRQHIFEAFAREETATVSGILGSGLGLTISKNMIEMMNGTITVKSEKNVGTEFHVRLPLRLVPGESSEVKKEESADIPVPTDKEKWRVLSVEDNELNREIVHEILVDFGFDVIEAFNGKEAVEIVSAARPGEIDLIMMDIQMPVMNGYEAVENIRGLADPELSRIPIVAMTANAFEEDRKQVFNCGMNGYVSKPIDVAELRRVVAEVLRK